MHTECSISTNYVCVVQLSRMSWIRFSSHCFPRASGDSVLLWRPEQRQWTVLPKKCKTATLFKQTAESTSLPNAQLGPAQNIFLFMHLTELSVCCLAQLRLMHLFARGKKTPAYLSPHWISQKCCQVELDRCGDWICRRQLHYSPNSSLYINLCLSLLRQLSSQSHLFSSATDWHWARALAGEAGAGRWRQKASAAALHAVQCRSGATRVVHHGLTHSRPMQQSMTILTIG